MSSLFGGGGGEGGGLSINSAGGAGAGNYGPWNTTGPANDPSGGMNWGKVGEGLKNFSQMQMDPPRFAPLSYANMGTGQTPAVNQSTASPSGVMSVAEMMARGARYNDPKKRRSVLGDEP